MKPLKIELKKIKHSPSLSEETNAYTADIYVDGKSIAYVKNSGHGGSTDVHALGKTEEARAANSKTLVAAGEQYIKALQEGVAGKFWQRIASEGRGTNDDKRPLTALGAMEIFADLALEDHLAAKEVAKTQRALAKFAAKCAAGGRPQVLQIEDGSAITWLALRYAGAPEEVKAALADHVKRYKRTVIKHVVFDSRSLAVIETVQHVEIKKTTDDDLLASMDETPNTSTGAVVKMENA